MDSIWDIYDVNDFMSNASYIRNTSLDCRIKRMISFLVCNEPTTKAHKQSFNLELLQVVYYIRRACNFTSTRRTFSSSPYGECIIIDIQPTECTCIQHFINIATDPGPFVVFLDWDSFLFEDDLSAISCKMLSFIEIKQTCRILAFIY